MAAVVWLVGCLVAWCGGGRVRRPKHVAGRYFLESAAAGRDERNMNWSIHGVFKQISDDNHCFPSIANMFFHSWTVARGGLVPNGALAAVRDLR